jgi:hypothetical protein
MATKNATQVNKVVNKETKKRTSNEIVINGINLLSSAKKNTKKEPKVKIKKVSFHSSLLNVNRLDKQENFSLSGALNRFKKQIPNDEQYKNIDSNVISKGLEFNTILEYVNKKCIEKQRFTVYSVGLAFNKFLKITLK